MRRKSWSKFVFGMSHVFIVIVRAWRIDFFLIAEILLFRMTTFEIRNEYAYDSPYVISLGPDCMAEIVLFSQKNWRTPSVLHGASSSCSAALNGPGMSIQKRRRNSSDVLAWRAAWRKLLGLREEDIVRFYMEREGILKRFQILWMSQSYGDGGLRSRLLSRRLLAWRLQRK